jgi:O-antigen ligase
MIMANFIFMAKLPAEQPASLRLASYLTLGMLFFLPLIYLPNSQSYMTLRYVVFGTVSLILALATLWIWLKSPALPRALFKNWFSSGMLGYLAAFLLVSFLSVDKVASFWSSFQRTDGAFALIFVSLFAANILTLLAFRGREFIYSLLRASVLGAACVSVLIMFYTYHTAGTWFEISHGGATIGNSSLAGAYVLWNVFFGILIVIKSGSKWIRLLWIAPVALMLLSPLFVNWQYHSSDSLVNLVGADRGAAIGIIFGLAIAAGVWLISQAAKAKKYSGASLLAAVLAATGWIAVRLFDSASGLRQAFDVAVGENRFIFWDIAIKAFKIHPWLGWGPYTFNIPYQLFYNPKMVTLPDPELWVDHAHNLIVETLATGGIVLLVALLWFLASIVLAAVKAKKIRRLTSLEASLIIGALAGWFLQAQFVFESLLSLVMLFLAASWTYAVIIDYQPAWTNKRFSALNKTGYVLAGLVALVLFIEAIVLPYKKDRVMFVTYESKLPARAERWQDFENGSPMGNGFDAAVMFGKIETTYERGIDSLLQGKPENKKIVRDELEAIASYLDDQTAKTPYGYEQALLAEKFYYLWMAAGNQFQGPQFDRAAALSDKTLKLGPTNPESYWIAAKIQFASKNYPEAKRLLEQAFALEPAAKQTNELILALAKATNDQAYYDSALTRAKQAIPNFTE